MVFDWRQFLWGGQPQQPPQFQQPAFNPAPYGNFSKEAQAAMQKYDLIPKKLAAGDLHNAYRKLQNLGGFGIIAMFMGSAFTLYSKASGLAIVAVMSGAFGFMLFVARRRMQYYEKTYGIRK